MIRTSAATALVVFAVILVGVGTVQVFAAGKCPPANSVKKLTSGEQAFKDASPIDLASFKTAKALLKKADFSDGQVLKVYIGNLPFSAVQQDMGIVNAVQKKGEAIVQLLLMNAANKIVPGEYQSTNADNKPFTASAQVRVKSMGIWLVSGGSAKSKGSVTISEITAKQVCGKFDLSGDMGATAGEFVADFEQ